MSPVLHVQQLVCMQYNLTLYGHIKTAEQRTIIQQYGYYAASATGAMTSKVKGKGRKVT